MRKLLIAIFLLSPLSLAACNTVEGFGQDLSKVGDQIEEGADEARD